MKPAFLFVLAWGTSLSQPVGPQALTHLFSVVGLCWHPDWHCWRHLKVLIGSRVTTFVVGITVLAVVVSHFSHSSHSFLGHFSAGMAFITTLLRSALHELLAFFIFSFSFLFFFFSSSNCCFKSCGENFVLYLCLLIVIKNSEVTLQSI